MYYDDHGVPHFHAAYSGDEASISIETLALLEGTIPRRAQRLIREWALLHRPELVENWRLARARLPLIRIDPLN
jgi:hypothetical protein